MGSPAYSPVHPIPRAVTRPLHINYTRGYKLQVMMPCPPAASTVGHQTDHAPPSWDGSWTWAWTWAWGGCDRSNPSVGQTRLRTYKPTWAAPNHSLPACLCFAAHAPLLGQICSALAETGKVHGFGLVYERTNAADQLSPPFARSRGFLRCLSSPTPPFRQTPFPVPWPRSGYTPALPNCAGLGPSIHLQNTAARRRSTIGLANAYAMAKVRYGVYSTPRISVPTATF